MRSSLEQRVIDLENLVASLETTVTGSLQYPYIGINDTYTITDADYYINCTANTFSVYLPTASGIEGTPYTIKNSGTGVVTLVADGSERIDSDASISLWQYDSITVVSTGTNWIIV